MDVVVPGDEGINISGVTVSYFNPNRFNSKKSGSPNTDGAIVGEKDVVFTGLPVCS